MQKRMRINYSRVEPEAAKPIYSMIEYLKTTGISEGLRNLIDIRASQINGCAFCLDMHTQMARAAGETEQRINCVAVWRESPFFSEREMAALELAEVLTRLSSTTLTDDLYEKVRKQFDEHEFVALVTAINVINCWNRLMISCGATAGMYTDEVLKREHPEYFSRD